MSIQLSGSEVVEKVAGGGIHVKPFHQRASTLEALKDRYVIGLHPVVLSCDRLALIVSCL